MKQFYSTIILLVLTFGLANCQTVKLSCIEKARKNDEGEDSILIKTCFIKSFKFISTSYPDYAGRYTFNEREVFIKKNNKYVQITNSKVFNKEQNELIDTINARILKDFHTFSSDPNTKECLTEIDLIPTYKVDDFEISFNDDEIFFEVHWGLSGACRSVTNHRIF